MPRMSAVGISGIHVGEDANDTERGVTPMRMNSLSAGALLAAALAVGLGQDVIAKPSTHSAADIAAIHDYTLTPDFLNKWKAMAADPEAPACSLMQQHQIRWTFTGKCGRRGSLRKVSHGLQRLASGLHVKSNAWVLFVALGN